MSSQRRWSRFARLHRAASRCVPRRRPSHTHPAGTAARACTRAGGGACGAPAPRARRTPLAAPTPPRAPAPPRAAGRWDRRPGRRGPPRSRANARRALTTLEPAAALKANTTLHAEPLGACPRRRPPHAPAARHAPHAHARVQGEGACSAPAPSARRTPHALAAPTPRDAPARVPQKTRSPRRGEPRSWPPPSRPTRPHHAGPLLAAACRGRRPPHTHPPAAPARACRVQERGRAARRQPRAHAARALAAPTPRVPPAPACRRKQDRRRGRPRAAGRRRSRPSSTPPHDEPRKCVPRRPSPPHHTARGAAARACTRGGGACGAPAPSARRTHARRAHTARAPAPRAADNGLKDEAAFAAIESILEANKARLPASVRPAFASARDPNP